MRTATGRITPLRYKEDRLSGGAQTSPRTGRSPLRLGSMGWRVSGRGMTNSPRTGRWRGSADEGGRLSGGA
jgi:hypothetical protein